jgi:hypothetical protein
MSEIRTDNINNASGDNDSGIDLSTNDQVKIKTANTTALTVDASQNVGIGTSSPDVPLEISVAGSSITNVLKLTTTGSGTVPALQFEGDASGTQHIIGRIRGQQDDANDGGLVFETESSGTVAERMRIDSSGNLLVSATTITGFQSSNTESGTIAYNAGGIASNSPTNDVAGVFNRLGNDGVILQLKKSGSTVGSINSASGGYIAIGQTNTFLQFHDSLDAIYASDGASGRDNAIDLGTSIVRFDDIYATNGTIQTSDQNEKNTITDSDLGIDFIKRLTPKSYIFNGKTRTHYGLIAQDVETVLTDINKPTSGFAGFIKTDISEEQDGSEYRYGLRYTEFVAPLIQAVKDQQAIIEDLQAKVTSLETENTTQATQITDLISRVTALET